MHGHSHGGQPQNQEDRADYLTRLGTLDTFRDCAGIVFIGMDIYNNCYELFTGEENEDSVIPLCVGAMMFLMSLGAVKVHLDLDKFHQTTNHVVVADTTSHLESVATEVEHDHTKPQTVPLLNDKEEKQDKPRGSCCPKLTGIQKLGLAADIWSHVIGGAGATVAVVQGIRSTFTDKRLTASANALIQLGGLIYSAASSGSGIRNCYSAMVEQNKLKEIKEEKCEHEHSHGPH